MKYMKHRISGHFRITQFSICAVYVIFLLSLNVTAAEYIENGSWTSGMNLRYQGVFMFTGYFPENGNTLIIPRSDTFYVPEFRVLLSSYLTENLFAGAELKLDKGENEGKGSMTGRLEQLFLRQKIKAPFPLFIQLGKFISPFGEYAQRHDSVSDFFIRPPLSYEYRTMICPDFVPGSNDGFINWKDRPELFRPTAAPPIWGAPYQFGAMVMGVRDNWTFRLGWMNSAASSDPSEWDLDLDQNHNYSSIIYISYKFPPRLKISLSYHQGPYMPDRAEPQLQGQSINDYEQYIYGIGIEYAVGRTEIRGEFFYDKWEVPNVNGVPHDDSWYLEIRQKINPGFYLTARISEIRFNRLPLDSGELEKWDYDYRRIQIGGGYWYSRQIQFKAEYSLSRQDGPAAKTHQMTSLQAVFRF